MVPGCQLAEEMRARVGWMSSGSCGCPGVTVDLSGRRDCRGPVDVKGGLDLLAEVAAVVLAVIIVSGSGAASRGRKA